LSIIYTKKIDGLHLKTPETDADIIEMATRYIEISPKGMIPVDFKRCILATRSIIKSGGYVKMIKVEDVIHGFVVGTLASSFHFSEKTVQQAYCFSNLKGYIAYRALILAHDGLIKYAENVKAKYIMSEANPFMIDNNFNKLLAIHGWETFGRMSLWRTSHHEKPSVNNFKKGKIK